MPESPGTARSGARAERDLLLLLVGGVAAALGLVVLVGWHTHRAVLVQVLPTFSPMQYNAALGFLISSGGLLAIAVGRRRLALGAGLLVAALGFLTLLEYLFDVSLGIDQLLFTPWIDIGAPRGRMSPLAALNFVLTGGALVVLGQPVWHRRHALMLGTLGSVITAVGLMALLGYLTGKAIGYAVGPYTDLAFLAAVGSVVLGGGILAHAWRHATVEGTRAPRWLPIPIAVGLFAVTLVLWQSLSLTEADNIDRATQFALAGASAQIPAGVQVRIQPLVRMAQRWEQGWLLRTEEREADALLIFQDFPSIRAIEWADPSFTVRWIVAPQGIEATQDRYLGFEEHRRSALEAARAGAEVAVTQTVELVQGGRGFLAVIAVRRNQDLQGFLVGVVDMRKLLEVALAREAPGYVIAVLEDGNEVYRRSGTDGLRDASEHGQQTDVDIYGVLWQVRVWPGPAVLAAARSPLPGAVLAFGAVLSLLIAATAGLAQTSRRRATEADTANRDLRRELVARRRAEQRIRQLNEELEGRVRERTAELEAFTYSVSHDLRAPLRQVAGFSKLLAEEYRPQLDPTAQQYVARIDQGARHMGLLVDELLGLARVGRAELSRRATGLNALVDDVLAELRPQLEGRQIDWQIGQLPSVECDPGLLRVVFVNLLANAVKFTRARQGAVIHVGTVAMDGAPAVFVRDNGVGFNMKYVHKLFGVFQRLHRAEDFEGTGVGLATVQRIIHKHGGRVWAEAEPDKGATFYFTLGTPSPTGVEPAGQAEDEV